MVKIAEERGLYEITDKIFEEVLLNFDEDLKKEYFPETR